MKNSRIMLVAAFLSVAVASSAMAGGLVWWEGTGQNPASTTISQGPGQSLQLECNTAPVPPGGGTVRCEWLIQVFYQTDGGARGWGLDLQNDPNSIDKIVIKQGWQYANEGTGLNQNTVPAGDPNFPDDGGYFLNHQGPQGLLQEGPGGNYLATANLAAGTYLLNTFLLSKTKFIGDQNSAFIFAAVGPVEFGGNDVGAGGYENVGLGSNPVRRGTYTGEFEGQPVIVIRNTPEPATIGLIGLGLVGLLRRRR